MKKIGVIGWKYNHLILEKINRLAVSGIRVMDYQNDPNKFQDIDTVIFCDVDLAQIEGDRDQGLDKIRDILAATRKLLLVNLNDEWVAELTKEIMKKSPVTVLDYNKNHFGNAKDAEKAVYLVGLANGLTIEQIACKLNDE